MACDTGWTRHRNVGRAHIRTPTAAPDPGCHTPPRAKKRFRTEGAFKKSVSRLLESPRIRGSRAQRAAPERLAGTDSLGWLWVCRRNGGHCSTALVHGLGAHESHTKVFPKPRALRRAAGYSQLVPATQPDHRGNPCPRSRGVSNGHNLRGAAQLARPICIERESRPSQPSCFRYPAGPARWCSGSTPEPQPSSGRPHSNRVGTNRRHQRRIE